MKRERKKEMDGEDGERDEVKEGGKTKKEGERKRCMFTDIHICIHIRLYDSSSY